MGVAILSLHDGAMRVIDPITLAYSERAGRTNSNSPNVHTRMFAPWHIGANQIACGEPMHALASRTQQPREAERIRSGALVRSSPGRLHAQCLAAPAPHVLNHANADRIERVGLGNAVLVAIELRASAGRTLQRDTQTE